MYLERCFWKGSPNDKYVITNLDTKLSAAYCFERLGYVIYASLNKHYRPPFRAEDCHLGNVGAYGRWYVQGFISKIASHADITMFTA